MTSVTDCAESMTNAAICDVSLQLPVVIGHLFMQCRNEDPPSNRNQSNWIYSMTRIACRIQIPMRRRGVIG